MSDALLPYYDRELNALRRLAAEFAEAHPKIAGRLRLAPGAVDDPHVARLLEGRGVSRRARASPARRRVPRAHRRIARGALPALPGARPVGRDRPVPGRSPSSTLPVRLPAGLAVETEPVQGEPCRFRTAWPLTLWPVEIESVRLSGLPLSAPANPLAAGAVSRAADRAQMQLGGCELCPARHRPLALLSARRRQCRAAALRAAVRPCAVGGLCRRPVAIPRR